ncbi:dTDP-4-dehydrorhamnose 3,5-epimerase family protein [bacterium]|nr:dTDP-4-dehydrorhamnose 3,5-epimerase family protein [bacterium]
MRIVTTKISGCYEIIPHIFEDYRGYLVKIIHKETFNEHGLISNFTEEFYSCSKKGVLRGLHFQVPPRDCYKIVYCVSGEVLDAVVDLRVGSPTYLNHILIGLSAAQGNALYIPPGLAHGFYVTSGNAIMIYKTSISYSPEHDWGILWNSAGILWPDADPIISVRDSKFMSLKMYVSPFVYTRQTK